MPPRSLKVLASPALALLLAAAALPAAAGEDRRILRCSAEGAGDISMHARYEVRGKERRFSVEFEAAPRSGFRKGAVVGFRVAKSDVGRDRLARDPGGDVEAEINFRNRRAEPGDDNKPFPAAFPAVRGGTTVKVVHAGKVVLGCTLR
mgnify:CR=1 FL=1